MSYMYGEEQYEKEKTYFDYDLFARLFLFCVDFKSIRLNCVQPRLI